MKDVMYNKLIYFVWIDSTVKRVKSTETAIRSFYGHTQDATDGDINLVEMLFDLTQAWNLTGKINFLRHKRQLLL
jgi:hypothetical protein